MREISLDRLRTLVEVIGRGSFAEVTRALHLTAPTVSLYTTELEDRVGVQLLSRKRGQMQPTAIGEVMVERACKLLADAEQALDSIQRQVQGLSGHVRLGASTGAIAHLLPQALKVLRRDHPGIDVQVAVLTSQEALVDLANDALDIGLVALPQSQVVGFAIKPWRRNPVMAFLPSHWSNPACITPVWLAAQPLILNDATTRLSRQTTEWLTVDDYHPVPRIQLNYNDAIKSLVAAGYDATLLPHEASVVSSDVRITMRPLWPALWRELGIAHRAGHIERLTQYVLDVLWRLRTRQSIVRVDRGDTQNSAE